LIAHFLRNYIIFFPSFYLQINTSPRLVQQQILWRLGKAKTKTQTAVTFELHANTLRATLILKSFGLTTTE
jgi:hypothetical protein